MNLKITQGRYSSQHGFSLVEMIVVMAMMGVVVMAVMSLYLPAVRSSSVQTEVSDIQANLRLAMNRMTKDLLLAGLLVNPGYDTGGAAGAIYWEGADDTDDLTIRTRSVGNDFARILASTNAGVLGLSDSGMAAAFPVGAKIRIFNPMAAIEAEGVGLDPLSYNEDDPSFFDDYIYTVTANDPTPGTVDGVPCQASITVTPVSTNFSNESLREGVVLRAGQRPMQTIRYRVNNGTLERIVNGVTQRLAREVDSVLFGYERSATGAVKRVEITLSGQSTDLAGGGAESRAKNRQLRTSVALRNVY